MNKYFDNCAEQKHNNHRTHNEENTRTKMTHTETHTPKMKSKYLTQNNLTPASEFIKEQH